MICQKHTWLALPVYPLVLTAGALILHLPVLKTLLLATFAAGFTVLAVALLAREEPRVPNGWRREIRLLQQTADRIRNRSVMRGGNEICTELRQCTAYFPYLSPSARREICEYYLPAFRKYLTAYRTLEECAKGTPSADDTMRRMEMVINDISRNFRHVCDRCRESASLQMNAETAVLHKRLRTRER